MTYPPKTALVNSTAASWSLVAFTLLSSDHRLAIWSWRKGLSWQEIWKPSKLNRLNDRLIKKSTGELFSFPIQFLPPPPGWCAVMNESVQLTWFSMYGGLRCCVGWSIIGTIWQEVRSRCYRWSSNQDSCNDTRPAVVYPMLNRTWIYSGDI